MKAITVEAFGGPDVLRIADLPEPQPAADEVVLAIIAAGVGYVDVMAREGRYIFPRPGFVPGLEVVGEVIAISGQVSSGWQGRKVIAFPPRGGGYGERLAVKASQLLPLPDDITPHEALAVGVNGLVAAIALDRAGVRGTDRVLVRGAGGGIGIWATQLAAPLACDVLATTSSAERGARLVSLGATAISNRRTDPPLGPERFDVIIDTVGGPGTVGHLDMLRANGRYVMCGGIEGPPPGDFGMQLMRKFHLSLSFGVLSLNSLTVDALLLRLNVLFDALRRKEVHAVVDNSFPILEAQSAHRHLESGEAFGKIILTGIAA